MRINDIFTTTYSPGPDPLRHLVTVCFFFALTTYASPPLEICGGDDNQKLWTHEDVLKFISPPVDYLTEGQCLSNAVKCAEVARQRILKALKDANYAIIKRSGDIFSITNLTVTTDTISVITPTNEFCRISVYAYQDVKNVLATFAARLEDVYALWSDIQVDYLKYQRGPMFILREKNLLDVVCFWEDVAVVIVRDDVSGESKCKKEVKPIIVRALLAILQKTKDVGESNLLHLWVEGVIEGCPRSNSGDSPPKSQPAGALK